jgi:hypothetical protein
MWEAMKLSHSKYKDMRFEVFTALKVQVAVFWVMTLGSDVTFRWALLSGLSSCCWLRYVCYIRKWKKNILVLTIFPDTPPHKLSQQIRDLKHKTRASQCETADVYKTWEVTKSLCVQTSPRTVRSGESRTHYDWSDSVTSLDVILLRNRAGYSRNSGQKVMYSEYVQLVTQPRKEQRERKEDKNFWRHVNWSVDAGDNIIQQEK